MHMNVDTPQNLYRMRNLQFQPCSHYKIRNLSLHTLVGT